MRVTKALSNNAVLGTDDAGRDVVALGRGIGHGRRPGDRLDAAEVERVFVAGAREDDQVAAFLADVPLENIRAAAQVADLAQERLGIKVTQALILALADHLDFAIRRQRDGISVSSPLAWEVSQLYPQEVAVGREALNVVARTTRVDLARDEAFALAMHFVNSQFATPGTVAATRMTETIARVFDIVASTTGIPIDPHAMSTARFVTHLRYLFVRLSRAATDDAASETLVDAIGNAHPEAFSCAEKVAHLIGMETGGALARSEVAYLALHIARLVTAARAEG